LDKDYQKTKFTVGTNQQWFVLTQDKIDGVKAIDLCNKNRFQENEELSY